jgi:cytochrome P450
MRFHGEFTSQDYFRNPGAAIEKLRDQGPVVEVRFPIIGWVWTTTNLALADEVLKDTDTFTIRKDDGIVAGFRWWMPGIVRTLANSMISMDEPDHSGCAISWTRPFAAAPCWKWSRIFRPPVMHSPMNCLRREARLTSSSGLRASCRCR